MHYVNVKGILSARNGMNLYRGCQHGCIYCDSRSRCYRMNHRFEDVAVKENAIGLLEEALGRKRAPCMIGTGSMCDPYTPVERDLLLTRRALEVIARNGCGVAIQTKSDLILRDLDLLAEINRQAKAVVQMTLTTMDDELCRRIEPNVAPTSRRLEVLARCREMGIPTVVWLCPILPYINDTDANIRGLLEACAAVGVRGILNFGMGLTLRDGSREYFYTQLDRRFPGLKERYIRTYGNAYCIPSPREPELLALYHSLCARHGMLHDNDAIFRWLNRMEYRNQLTFFDQEAI